MRRRASPPRHRHDGTSPLPLGMDWSPPPKRWEGRNTLWPHDPHTGWSYCVMIPSWVVQPESGSSTDSLLNPIIFYRVLVGIQSPEGVSTSRGILRRFSDFLKLFSAVKKAFPRKNIPSAPPKHALLRINSSRLLLEERRCALEDWMGKLLSDIDISRSAPVAAFLELEVAARSSFQDVNSHVMETSTPGDAIATTSSFPVKSPLGVSVADWSTVASNSQSIASDFGSDSAYETSDLGTPSKGKLHISETGTYDLSPNYDLAATTGASVNGFLEGNSVLDHQEEFLRDNLRHDKDDFLLEKDASYGNSSGETFLSKNEVEFTPQQDHEKLSHHTRKLSDESIGSDISSIRGSELSSAGISNLNGDGSFLGGGEAPSSIEVLSNMEMSLNGAQIVLPLDQRHKMNRILVTMQRRIVTAKTDMEDLIARLNQEMAVKEYLSTKVKDLEGELEITRQKSKENLQQAILIERERVTQMQWDMDELRRKCLEIESKLKLEESEKTRAESEKTTASGEREMLLLELDAKKTQSETLLKRLEELEMKSKADIKVLVKEVKHLRSFQAELKEALNESLKEKMELERVVQKENQKWESTRSTRKKLLHECKVLRQRLQECSVNFFAEEEDKFTVTSSSLSDALDLLATSDSRISLLLAEAQLLERDDEHDIIDVDKSQRSQPTGNPTVLNSDDPIGTDFEIRKMLTDTLIDNARLRKQVNSVIGCALKMIYKPEKEDSEELPSRKTVLSRFLEK